MGSLFPQISKNNGHRFGAYYFVRELCFENDEPQLGIITF